MKRWKLLDIILLSSILNIFFASCVMLPGQTSSYDPSKNYAAILVINSPNSTNILDTIKQKSINEGYEIGPVVYYNPGTTDFEPLIQKLTPSKQITLIWIAGSLMDVPNIQKAIKKIEYKGFIRYMPAIQATGQ